MTERVDGAAAGTGVEPGCAGGTHEPLAPRAANGNGGRSPRESSDPFIRAENEDDDGYDPYSDRRPDPEPLFERDPWD